MGPPTIWHRFRQTVGRAFRETGQAIDRVGLKTAMLAETKNDYYDDPVIYEDFFSRHRHLFPLLTAGTPQIDKNVAYLAPCSTLVGSVVVKKGASIWYGAILRADRCENVESLLQHEEDSDVDDVEGQVTDHFNKPRNALSSTYNGDIESSENNTKSEFNWQNSKEVWSLDPERFNKKSKLEYDLGGGIFIGEDTNVQDNAILTARIDHCIIGNGVTIGHSAQIHSATIGNNALIGMGSVLLPGVKVGDEAFVAAGAVVTANTIIDSGELWIGNPARKLRDLSREERSRLSFQSSEYKILATGQRSIMQLGGNLPFDSRLLLSNNVETPEVSVRNDGILDKVSATTKDMAA